ncbi:MAG TPA: NAD-dependent epimerase/dehydratase family protein [Vicinamibacterales bacterium]|nr:NAD-dependent epimerase/dehydratase family protein [Vicinamibacterales bacterium]
MKALVTGAAGFIASHLSGQLLDRGAEVIGIDCFADYYPRPIKEANLEALRSRPGFSFIESTIQGADLDRLLDGVTHVFHLAAQAGVRKSWGHDFQVYTTNNIEATQVLLEACVGKPLHRLVYASSSSVYGDAATIPMREDAVPHPLSPYGVTKLAAEHLCHLYSANHRVPATSVRYFTVYGPRQRPDMAFNRFLKAARRGDPIAVFGDGGQTRDFTFVTDAVAGTIAAGERGVPGRAYNLGGGSRVSLNEVLDIIGRVTGQPLHIERGPAQKGDVRDTYADTSLARTDLGFQPTVSLADGLAEEYRWLASASVA